LALGDAQRARWPTALLGHRLVLHIKSGGYGDFYAAQPSWLKRLIRMTLSQADAIVILSECLREQLRFLPSTASKVVVIPNTMPLGLDPEIIRPKRLPRRGPVRLLYLSNMIRSKGYTDVLAACRILHHERRVPIRCDFCGEFMCTSADDDSGATDEAKAGFFDLVEAWRLGDVVSYHGAVTGSVKQRFLESAHVLLLPTAYPWEGQPICIIEALAFGTPVIGFGRGSVPDECQRATPFPRKFHTGSASPSLDPPHCGELSTVAAKLGGTGALVQAVQPSG